MNIKEPPINYILCSTYKNKHKNEKNQCPNKRKNNLFFCGKHKNETEIIEFPNNNVNNVTNVSNVSNVTNDTINNELKSINSIINKTKSINDLNDEKNVTNATNAINTIDNLLNSDVNINININTKIQITNSSISKRKILKHLEKNKYYNDYLNIRKNYIKENTKYIELIDYIENNKLDTYPLSKINSSLEYYKLIKYTNEGSKFLQAINNTEKLKSFFDLLLKANQFLPQLIKLQRYIKKSLKLYNKKIHGPAYINRSLCVNDSDFFTLDELKDIPNNEFISFTDEKGFVYGFHIDSITQLILKSDENYFEQFNKKIKNKHIIINNNKIKLCYQQFIKLLYNHYNKIKIINPYTRFIIDGTIKLNVLKLYARKEYNINKIEEIVEIVDIKTSVRNKCLNIFQKIDFHGYQTDINWLYDQNNNILKIFYKKLALLWNFEFGLNNEARYKISKSHNIFVNLHDIMISKIDKYTLLDKILEPVNAIVSNGETDADKQSGCIIILYALAFINNRCILANPWLA